MSEKTYFIGARGSKAIKIGTTSGDPVDRLRCLQTGCPELLEMLCVVELVPPFDIDLFSEAAMHKMFDHNRIRGEWFKWDNGMSAFLTCLRYSIKILQGDECPQS